MTAVAFATHEKSAGMLDDDRLVADLLLSRGVPVVSAVWDDPSVDWSRFSCVVIRSTWDYFQKPDSYAEWLRFHAAAGTNFWNPAETVLANLDKRYLADLAERGVEVVPSEYLPAAGKHQLRRVMETRGWEQAVVKPAVSAGAHGTWRASLATVEADQARLEEQCGSTDLLIQPFMEEVTSQGEWSLVFFGGQYSHAVLKRPGEGDFRVQPQHGGGSAKDEPAPQLISQAREILSLVTGPLLYARVDGVDRGGRFVLMELEINEPFLFLGLSPAGPRRFAEAIQAVL